ncbi:hypothetical protein AAEU32_03545 [Pseudoalteromonas sp. SSDWG2]
MHDLNSILWRARVRFSLLLVILIWLFGSDTYAPSTAMFHAADKPNSALSWYYRAPHHISFAQLNEQSLRHLAANDVAGAQLHLALQLIDDTAYKSARVYWQRALMQANQSVTDDVWRRLANVLVEHKQWHSLSALQQHNKLTDRARWHWRFVQGFDVDNRAQDYAQELGFNLSLESAQADVCPYNILLLGDSLKAMNRLDELKQRYEQHPLPQSGLICLSTPYYVADELNCGIDERNFSRCDWRALASQSERFPKGFDFIVMMTRSGLANVQSGVMQLSTQAKYHTFVHELMHFAGFIDEYQAPIEQQDYCQQQGRIFANLYVGDNPPQAWVKSPYCANGRGYKPAAYTSVMEHSEVAVSPQYKRLWQAQLGEPEQLLYFNDLFYALSGDNAWQNYRKTDGVEQNASMAAMW